MENGIDCVFRRWADVAMLRWYPQYNGLTFYFYAMLFRYFTFNFLGKQVLLRLNVVQSAQYARINSFYS